MKIRYTSLALIEEAAILSHIKERSPTGADKVSTSIQRALARVQLWPFASTATSNPLIRRTIATPYDYAIFYEPTVTEIIVHDVRHTARKPVKR